MKPPDVSGGAPSRPPRHRAREFVVQGLYQWRVAGADAAAIEAHAADDEEFSRADRTLFVALLRGVLEHHQQLIVDVGPFIDRPFDELSPVEAAILLLGAYELAHQPHTPYRVVINEAIELAKTYGGTDGHKYVNGVLDKLAPRYRAVEIEARRSDRRRT